MSVLQPKKIIVELRPDGGLYFIDASDGKAIMINPRRYKFSFFVSPMHPQIDVLAKTQEEEKEMDFFQLRQEF